MLAKSFKRTLAIVCAITLMLASLCVFTVSFASGEGENLLSGVGSMDTATGTAVTYADGTLTTHGGEFASTFAGVSLAADKVYKYEFTLTMGEGDYNLRIPIRHTGDFTKGQWISLWGAGFGQVRIAADYWGGTLLTDSSVCGDTLLESGKTYKFTVVTSATDMIVSIDGVEKVRATGAAAITGAGTVGFGANNGNFTVSDFSLTEVAAVEEPAATNLLEGVTALNTATGTASTFTDGVLTTHGGEFADVFANISLAADKTYKYEFTLNMGEGDYNLRIPVRHTGDFTKGQWISLWGAGFGQIRIAADYWGGTLLTDSSVCGDTLLESGKTYKFTVETSATDMVVYVDGVEKVRATGAAAITAPGSIGFGANNGNFTVSDFALYEIDKISGGAAPEQPGTEGPVTEEPKPDLPENTDTGLEGAGENLIDNIAFNSLPDGWTYDAETDTITCDSLAETSGVYVPGLTLSSDKIYVYEFTLKLPTLSGVNDLRLPIRFGGSFTDGHYLGLNVALNQIRVNRDYWTNDASSIYVTTFNYEANKEYKFKVVSYPDHMNVYVDGKCVLNESHFYGTASLSTIDNAQFGWGGYNVKWTMSDLCLREANAIGDQTIGMDVSGNLVPDASRPGETVDESKDNSDYMAYIPGLTLEADRTYLYEFELTLADLNSEVRVPVRFGGDYTKSHYVAFNAPLGQIRINSDYWTNNSELSVATFNYVAGKTYKVKLAAYKDHVDVYVDGLQVLAGTANLPSVANGQIGYAGWNAHYTISKLSVVAELSDADKAAVSDYNAKYALIGTVTLASGDAIKAARDAYNAMTAIQKTCVDENVLKADEEYYQILVDKSQQGAHSEDINYYDITVDDLMGWNHWGPPNTEGIDWLTYANGSVGVRFTWNNTGVNVRQGINRGVRLDGFHAEFSNLTVPANSNGAKLALFIGDMDKVEYYTQYYAPIGYFPFALVVDMENGTLVLVHPNDVEEVLVESDKLTIDALKGADWEVKIRRVNSADANSDWKVTVNGVEAIVPNSYFSELTRLTQVEDVYLTICPWSYSKSFSLDLVSIHGGNDVCADEISDEQLANIETVNNCISSIGAITPDKGELIETAMEAYKALDDSLKMLVGGYDTLVRAAEVFEVVKAIDDIGTVTLDSTQAIAAAKESFHKLTEAKRALVTNYQVLVDAEMALYTLKNNFNFENALKFEGAVGVYDGEDVDNSSLIPVIRPDSEVVMEDSGFGIQSPDWVKTLIIEEMNPYFVLAGDKMGTGMVAQWDGQAPGLFETELAIQVLDHLAETGVNGLWLTPINDRGETGNGYSSYGMHTIDPMLTGTRDYEEGWAVFKKFVDEAHKRNIRVFIDAVTWGTTKDAPLYTEHPDWYTGSEAWGGWAWKWSNNEMREWYINTCVDVALKTGIDGWRCDCEPGTTGYEVYAAIRAKLLEKGEKVATFSETGNDALGNGFDFGEHMLYHSNPNEWSANKMFLDGRYNMVDAIKDPIGTPIIGTDMAIALGECASQRFYGSIITCHDYSKYAVNGRTVNAGYHAIFAPFIPIWYVGEEFNNTHKQLYEANYVEQIDFNEIETNPEQKAFFNNYKQMIRIRRTYTDLFQNFPEHLYDTNLCGVDVFGSEWLQAYARYANGRAAIVVGNNNSQVESDTFTVVVPFEEAEIVGNEETIYTVTELMSGKTITGSKSEIAAFEAQIPNGSIAVFLVEATENVPETDAPATDKPVDTDEPVTESPKTGDALPFAAIILMLSGLAVLFACVRKERA